MVAATPVLARQASKRSRLVGMTGALVLSAVLVSNLALHRDIDESAGLEWAAINRLDEPTLTASLGIRQRYGMFFALRPIVDDRTAIEIPTSWRNTEQERQFEEFMRPVLIGVSEVSDIRVVDSVPYGSVGDWFDMELKSLRKRDLIVAEGRSRPNGRQPWYRWRIIAGSENPRVLQVIASTDNDFLLIDPRVGLSS